MNRKTTRTRIRSDKQLQNFVSKSIMRYEMFGDLFSKAMKSSLKTRN